MELPLTILAHDDRQFLSLVGGADGELRIMADELLASLVVPPRKPICVSGDRVCVPVPVSLTSMKDMVPDELVTPQILSFSFKHVGFVDKWIPVRFFAGEWYLGRYAPNR